MDVVKKIEGTKTSWGDKPVTPVVVAKSGELAVGKSGAAGNFKVQPADDL
jgi:hypothetical protein